MKSLVAPLEPLFDERAKHPVLLVEAIEKSANVTCFAEHAISYVDGTFIASHDAPPREWILPPTRAVHSMNKLYLAGEDGVQPWFCAEIAQVPCGDPAHA
jgi:hypothetical protein